MVKLSTNFERNRAIRDFCISPTDLEHVAFFAADTLCHAVTSTFDPMTLKLCGTSRVTWSKSVQNLSEIEQSS